MHATENSLATRPFCVEDAAFGCSEHQVSEWDLSVVEEDGYVHVTMALAMRLAPHNSEGPRLAALCAFTTDRSSIVERVSIHSIGQGRRGIVIELRAIDECQLLAAARVRAAALAIGSALRSCPGPGEKTVFLSATPAGAIDQMAAPSLDPTPIPPLCEPLSSA